MRAQWIVTAMSSFDLSGHIEKAMSEDFLCFMSSSCATDVHGALFFMHMPVAN